MAEKKSKLTIGEILTAYQKTNEFVTDSAFAEALGVSKQSLSQWLHDVHQPSAMWLRALSLSNPGTWKEQLANDLLRAMGEVHWVQPVAEVAVSCDGGGLA